MSNRDIIYYDKKKQIGLSVSISDFRGTNYIHITLNQYDPDGQFWYKIKGLSVTEDYVSPIIIGLERVEQKLAVFNLPDVRQLEFDFMKDKYDKK
jgi:hypothetical protein